MVIELIVAHRCKIDRLLDTPIIRRGWGTAMPSRVPWSGRPLAGKAKFTIVEMTTLSVTEPKRPWRS